MTTDQHQHQSPTAFTVYLQDTPQHALHMQRLLDIPRHKASQLGHSSIAIQNKGIYEADGQQIDLRQKMVAARQSKKSFAPDRVWTIPPSKGFPSPTIRIHNETTLMAARRYAQQQKRVLVLNFASGIAPGGGFLKGSRAQEETLCFASTLYDTLKGDPLYQFHRNLPHTMSSSYAIYSTAHVFRDDEYNLIAEPWPMHVFTCAAPDLRRSFHRYSTSAQVLLHERIERLYTIAASFKHEYLVLGAWGCGAFGNDAYTTACSFRDLLQDNFAGHFKDITFAISDWSEERRFLRPFYEAFSQQAEQ